MPLVSQDVIVSLIGSAATAKGLKVWAALGVNTYSTGTMAGNAQLASVNLRFDHSGDERNYASSQY